MTGEVRSDGWWQASDGRWYPPESHPDYVPPAPPPPPAAAEPPPSPAPPPPPAAAEPPPPPPAQPAASVYAPAPPPPGGEFPPTERTPIVDPTQQTVIGAVPPVAPPIGGVPPLAPPPVAGPPEAWPTPQDSGPPPRAWYQKPVTYVVGGIAAAALVAGGLFALLGGGDDGDDTATDPEPTTEAEPTVEPEATAEPETEPEPTVDPATQPTATPLATPTTAPAEPTATPLPVAPPVDPDDPAPDPDAIIQFVEGDFVETDFGTDWIMVLENTSTDLAASTVFVNVEALGADGATVATSFASTSYLPPGGRVTFVGTFFDPDAPVADFSADWEWFENPPDPSLAATFTLGEAQVTSDEFTAEITVPISHDGTTDRQLIQVNAAFYRGGNLVGTELTFVDVPVGATANAEFVLFGELVDQGWDRVDFAVVP